MSQPAILLPGALTWTLVLDGAEMAILDGDPAKPAEFYLIRFRTNRDIHVPLHWHPLDEHLTVITGPFEIAFAPAPGDFRAVEPGGHVSVPAGLHHTARYGAGTVVEVSGIGPFEMVMVDRMTDPAYRGHSAD